ncbi:NrdH-redoxin [Desulforamulus aquiferis]|uniref:NrdH-redoxin n=1 Tax=Desulforamulus aquiferis TaxID=1397668 RepID=A0AAW7ZH79_9FIRM|nr:NrdH-redoxin [Desulforamulus aquiferis]MDO7788742.1 NrdH-redoxin [Desulforamulus aquiferis]RYD05583.1 glutaredoxin [Desulforamulus aquiferis]
MGDYNVTLFVSPWNKSGCDEARKFLEGKGINFEEKSTQDSGARGELINKTGGLDCPTIVVNGHIVVGYKPNKWEHLLLEEPLELT